MNLWPIRLAVIAAMGTAFAVWLVSAPFYLNACYDFDFWCSNQWLWRLLFLAGPPALGALVGVGVARLIERYLK